MIGASGLQPNSAMLSRSLRFSLLVVLSLVSLQCSRSSSSTPSPTPPDTSSALKSAISARSAAFVDEGDRGRHAWQDAQRFYKQNGYQLAWSDGTHARAALDGLINAIRAADQDGLEPGDYHVDSLDAARRAALDVDKAVALDLRATYTYLRYATDLSTGTIDPEDLNPQWHASPRGVSRRDALQAGLSENNIGQSLLRLAPQSPQYLGLKHQLGVARQKQDAAGIEQIVMNMERWRWLPDDLGSRYLMVNIPAFRLDAIENGKSVLDMKVVTGKKASPTPVLADRMTTVVFSPYWNIPQDIVQKEILPKVEKDPGYLEKNHMEADGNGNYRQLPGTGNSLGQVKFIFPNHFNVYLHDTPSQSLFERIERDFSHGCVRLDEPLKLAQYVLRDQPEWTEEKIKAAMAAGTERSVALKQQLPIYLVYFTAWENNGALEMVPDVYGIDRRHIATAGGQ
jgi:murein L,D-transpeptidase YcbB/YkuD